MDFQDSQQEAAFRTEARAWLKSNATREQEQQRTRRKTALVGDDETLQRARVWQSKIYDAGWACITWPKEYGCRSGTPMEHIIWREEVANYVEPDGFFTIGTGMCGPALMEYASEEQKASLLPRMARGDDVWCQLFSEPGAGSDVAGLSTSAKRDGDTWRVNGQKIWTSGAHYSDYGVLLCRTDASVPKHKGLTMFFINMKQPGIEVRQIHQADGGRNFNEVYFTDAEIPDSQRIGELGSGWQVALLVLMNERLAVGGMQGTGLDQLRSLIREVKIDGTPAIRHHDVRQRIAQWHVLDAGLRHLYARMLTALSRGETPGPEASVSKMVSAALYQDISSYAVQLLGPVGAVMDAEGAIADLPQGGQFAYGALFAPGGRVAGGTDEIMRNIVAEQVLGLPRGERPDKGVPFDQLRRLQAGKA